MSMVMGLQQIAEAEIDSLHANPDLYEEFDEDDDAHPFCYLDKSWHGIHYLLTGTAWEGEVPLNFLLGGGTVLGSEPEDEDEVEDYGPPRILRANEVHELDTALKPLTVDVLRSRFNPAEMMALDIYPTIWDRDPKQDDTLGYLLGYYEEIKAFVHDAARRGNGLIVSLS